jgi:hypothetical protein
LYDQGDPRVRILYKYRSCLPHNLSILDVNGIWFSRHADLNDPFDCLIRLPEKHTDIELAQLAALLRGAAPYTLAIDNGEDAIRYISSARELGALECIGLLAGQLKHPRLLEHLKIVRPDDRDWLVGLVEMATEIHRTLLADTGIFSLSEVPDHPLMWAHYAASHSGFCVGYVCPVGIDSPRNIYKINYAQYVPLVTPRKLVHDPHDVLMDQVLTKPADWSYEREWRVTLGSIAGVVENWLAPRRVIFGARIGRREESAIRHKLTHYAIEFMRVHPRIDLGPYRLELQPA